MSVIDELGPTAGPALRAMLAVLRPARALRFARGVKTTVSTGTPWEQRVRWAESTAD